MPPRHKLKIGVTADHDLTTLYEYGFVQWGEERADLDYDALINHFDLLCDNPFLYAAIDHIRPGYRLSICGVHSIYYKVSNMAVEMIAVTGRQDF